MNQFSRVSIDQPRAKYHLVPRTIERGIRRLILDEDGKSSSRCMIIRDHTAASMQPCILSDVSYCVLTAAITFLEQRVSIVYFSREGRFINAV